MINSSAGHGSGKMVASVLGTMSFCTHAFVRVFSRSVPGACRRGGGRGRRLRAAAWRLPLLPALLPAVVAAATNLVFNGGFELPDPGDPRRPAGWALPDGLGVRWEEGPPGTDGRAIWLDTAVPEREMAARWRATGLTNLWDIPRPGDNPIADTYGLSYYSDPFPVASGVVCRLRCDVRGKGGMKVWVRGYGIFRGRRVRRYEALLNCQGRQDAWTTREMVFHPTRHRPEVDELRVMLYAFHPPGLYGFDNVVVEPLAEEEAAAGDSLPATAGD